MLSDSLIKMFNDLEAETGVRPKRVEFPDALHVITLAGVEVWGNHAIIGRLWLELNPVREKEGSDAKAKYWDRWEAEAGEEPAPGKGE